MKKYGKGVTNKVRRYLVKKLSKYLKKWGSRYRVESEVGAVVRVIEKRKRTCIFYRFP